MTLSQLQAAALTIAAVTLGLALILLVLALRLFRKSRRDSYWRRRRAAGNRGWQLTLLALALTFGSGLMCVGGSLSGWVVRGYWTATPLLMIMAATDPPPLPTAKSATATLAPTLPFTASFTATALPSLTLIPPTATLTLTIPPPPTNTPRPTLLPTLTSAPTLDPTVDPTATPTLVPTTTPTTTPQIGAQADSLGTLQSSVTPLPDANLWITGLAQEVSTTAEPIGAGSTFVAGFKHIYLFVGFSQLSSGMLWRGALLWDGRVINHYARLWDTTASGTGYFFFNQPKGFQAGNYEIRLYLGQSLQPISTAAFTVNER